MRTKLKVISSLDEENFEKDVNDFILNKRIVSIQCEKYLFERDDVASYTTITWQYTAYIHYAEDRRKI